MRTSPVLGPHIGDYPIFDDGYRFPMRATPAAEGGMAIVESHKEREHESNR